MNLRSPFSIAFLLLALAACANDVSGPRALGGLPEGLKVSLSVPEGVAPREAFIASLNVTNVTADTIWLGTPNSCFFHPVIHDLRRRFAMAGTLWGCTQLGVTHAFPPGETRSFVWDMKAEVYARDRDGQLAVTAAPKGVYVVRVRLNVLNEGEKAPEVQALFRVR